MPDIVTNVLYQDIDRLQEKVKELEAERDGYRNGQMQLQDTLSTVMDSNAKWAAENKRLCKRIAELEAENHRLIVQRDGAFERWKSAIAKYPNGADGCCCLFDDNENQVQWCTPHAELRDENDALTAERDKLKARAKELESDLKINASMLAKQHDRNMELEADRDAAQGDNGKLREAIETMILFIPEGWQMPLGWNRVVAQAQEAIGGKP